MKLNKFKNTILLVYLAIFLFGLFVPFSQSFAQSQSSPLFIEAGKLALNSGDDVFIAARTWNLGNKDITFKISSDNGKTFSSTVDGVTLSGGGICTTGSVGSDYKASCQISFKSTKNGTFILKASLVFNGPKNSNEVTLVVTGKTTEIVCTPPKILNTAKDACIDPPVPIPPETPTPPVNTNTTYTPLAPLPGLSTPNCVGTDGKPCIDTQDSTKKPNPDDSNLCPFGNYLNIMIKLIIGIAGVLAMVMIVMGGIEYMTSDLISSKEAGKEQITHAVLGLLLALGAYLILNTINPQLLSACLDKLPQATIVISPEDTSTGSSTSLCLSTTNPPNPENATAGKLTLNNTINKEYIPERDKLGMQTGVKLLITAQAAFEGFSSTPPPGTKSYKTKNPGNIGNTDNGATVTFNTLAEGIKKQRDVVERVSNGSSKSYKIGSKPTCALGNEVYNGYLYQYLRIYATGARTNNNYLNAIIGYFKDNGKTITPKTTISEIYNLK